MTQFRFLVLALPVVLAACATPPPATRPTGLEFELSQEYLSAPDSPASPDGWLARFEDPDLRAFVDTVLADNLDLRQAAERLDNVRLVAVQAVGDRLPELDASLGASRARRAGQTATSYSASLGLGWEIDLWGKLRNSARAAVADYQAQAADYYGARLSLAAAATRAWFNAVALHEQMELARRAYESYRNSAELIQSRYESGTSDALDLRLALANTASARALLASREQSYAAALRNLEVLAGDYPSATINTGATLPELVAAIPAGLPSELVARRPDIVAAERDFAAAQQRATRARKDLLPSLRLTGEAGGSSDELENIFDNDNFVWNLVGGLVQPLFYGGQLRAQAGIAENNAQIAALAYAQTVLDALSEVEQALGSEVFLREREAAARVAMEQARAAEDLAWEQYVAGVGTDIISVLESQRRSINAQTEYIDVLNARLQNRVDLHVALGGSFDAEPVLPDVGNPVSPLDVVGP